MAGHDTPCTVDTAQGVSVLYRNRYLFSRYAPQKTLQKRLATSVILPETLILCLSPVLPFPVDLIREKIYRENIGGCFILCAEADAALYDFYLEQTQDASHIHDSESETARSFCPDAALFLRNSAEIASALEGASVNKNIRGTPLPDLGFFKRILIVEASGAVQLYRNFYDSVCMYAQNAIGTFWRNRMTLVKLGRLFSRNVLKNTVRAAYSPPLKRASIQRPVLVAGAGTSLNALIPFIRRHADSLYILAVDAAFRPLYDNGIQPDALVTVESQVISRRSFIGARGSGVPLIADMCARSANLRVSGGNVSFFLSEYAQLPLLARIKKALPDIPVFPPLGSVGLAAVEAALFLRAEGVSIFVCGLDFSYPAGLSHCKESPSQKEVHCTSQRLMPAGNPASAFRDGAFFIKSKDGAAFACDPSLHSYAELFSARYKNAENIYDLALSGAPTALPFLSEQAAERIIEAHNSHYKETDMEKTPENVPSMPCSAKTFCEEEKKHLRTLRSALTGEYPLNTADLKKLLEKCSYLYVHFPDGQRGPSLSQSFLNRVRSELDVFLKDIEIATAARKSMFA